jgi:hypothetical protein
VTTNLGQVTLCPPKRLLQIILQDSLLSQDFFLEKSFSQIGQERRLLLKNKFQISKSLVKPIRSVGQRRYLSAVPHQICAHTDISATKVADILAAQVGAYQSRHALAEIANGCLIGVLDHIAIQATPTGYLEFRIDDWAIAQWITGLTQPIASLFAFSTLPSLRPAPPHHTAKSAEQTLFPVQHAHARCCSLLRLAALRQPENRLNLLEPPLEQWEWAQANPAFWLTSTQVLRMNATSERQLISQCLTVLDELPWQADRAFSHIHSLPLPPSQITTLAKDLADAFHAMHQQCQIWGALQNAGSDRVAAHLGLILVTQKLLYGLLTGLGVMAPEEL